MMIEPIKHQANQTPNSSSDSELSILKPTPTQQLIDSIIRQYHCHNSNQIGTIVKQKTMKFQALSLALSAPIAAAFAPPASIRPASKLAALDPSSLHDLPQHVDTLQNFFSSFTIADLDVDAVSSAVAPVVDAAVAGSPDAVDAAAAAADSNGWFGFLTLPIESLLQVIHTALQGVPNAWGLSIILMTVLIKALTFPLTKSQLQSTNKMQVSSFGF